MPASGAGMMLRRLGFFELLVGSLLLALLLFAALWMIREDPEDKPYLKILGAGFVFNYRVADVYYGFTARVVRPLPVGSVIEASFEDPGGGADHVVRIRVGTASTRYSLRSPPVRGVRAGVPYRISFRVLNREETTVLWTHSLPVRSQIDDIVVPEKPLTVGPGYHRAD